MVELLQAVPALVRQRIYLAYLFLLVLAGAIDVGLEAAEVGDPVWFTVAVKVLGYFGIGFAGLAAANVTSRSEPKPAPDNPPVVDRGDYGEVSTRTVAVVALVVALVVAFFWLTGLELRG